MEQEIEKIIQIMTQCKTEHCNGCHSFTNRILAVFEKEKIRLRKEIREELTQARA